MACFAFAACDDNPVNENTEDTVGLSVNPTFAVVDAADTTRVEAVRQPTRVAVSFTACDAKILVEPDPERVAIENPDRTLVIGQTLGETCVNASGAGKTASAVVNVVPSDIEATIASPLGSGASVQVDVTFLDKAGSGVTGLTAEDLVFSVGDPDVASVDASGVVTGKAPGTTTVRARLTPQWGAPREAVTNEFTVEPSTFLGTATSNSGNSGDKVTYTAGGGQPDFDEDTEVVVGGLRGFVLGMGSLTTVVLYGVPAGETEVLFTSVGPDQLALATTFDVAAFATDDVYEPNWLDNPAGPFEMPISDIGVVDEAKVYDFWRFDLAAATALEFLLDWDGEVNRDLDLLVVDLGFTRFYCGGAGGTATIPEHFDCTLPAGSYMLWIDNYAQDGLTNYHVMVTAGEQ
jgi:hypothetical protein